MKLVLVESPCRGYDYGPENRKRNREYAIAACRDCLTRGEAPYSSFLHFDQPGLLDDTVPAERELGIMAGLAWGAKADATVVYTDLAISEGMVRGMEAAEVCGRPIEFRTIPGWLERT